MGDLVLKEETYGQTMDGVVVPYLEARKTAFMVQRDGGHKLNCMKYMADDPVGVVIISHGFTETAEKYLENIYYFVKKHYHVYIHDHCGHGYSYRLTKDLSLVHVDSYGRYIRDLLELARRAGEENPGLPLYLYAHSMGGGVGAAALAAEPELFQKAVLTSPMIRPITAGIPWPVTCALAGLLCAVGRAEKYIPGGHPFDGKETFETSPSSNRERYWYYQKKRESIKEFQMTSPSCGWLYGAVKLNRYLQKEAWKKIRTPILLFQADDDTFVVGKQQRKFVDKINRAGNTSAELVFVPGTKHEIFNSSTEILDRYWETVFGFLAD